MYMHADLCVDWSLDEASFQRSIIPLYICRPQHVTFEMVTIYLFAQSTVQYSLKPGFARADVRKHIASCRALSRSALDPHIAAMAAILLRSPLCLLLVNCLDPTD